MINRLFKLIVILSLVICAGACMHAQVSDKSEIKKEASLSVETKPRVLIVYQSKYGSTKQYAQWIRQEIPGDLAEVGDVGKYEFAKYDVIIFGGYVRMARIVVAPLIKESWDAVKGKNVVLFSTSGVPPDHPNIQKIYGRSLPEEVRKEIKYFPLPGRMVKSDLGYIDRLLVAVGQIMEKDESMAKRMREDYDEVKKENLLPLLEYVKARLAHSPGR